VSDGNLAIRHGDSDLSWAVGKLTGEVHLDPALASRLDQESSMLPCHVPETPKDATGQVDLVAWEADHLVVQLLVD